MDWLSLCVCGTKRDSNNGKIKKDGKRKKSKKSKKNSKQKGSSEAPFIVDEFLRKSQDDQPKEIAEREWANGEIVNYFNDGAKNQFGSTDRADPSKINGSPSCQIVDDREIFQKAFKHSERNAGESAREPCDIDHYGNVTLHSRCASSTTGENERQVECISDERDHNEEVDLDESIPRSGEPEDSPWTSEIEDSLDTVRESSFDRKHGERISSRINFSKEEQGKTKVKVSPKKKGTKKNTLPPIKKTSRGEDNKEPQAHRETNKFGFKKTAASHERIEVRKKLNSCSFEVRPFQAEERGGKTTRIRGEGSMIPRLASPMRQGTNPTKNDNDKSEIVHNGTSLRIKNCVHVGYLEKKN